MNYVETQMKSALSTGYPVDPKGEYMSRTIGQNIDQQIANLKVEIERLQGVKSQLVSGSSLLDVRIEDLRRAMNY